MSRVKSYPQLLKTYQECRPLLNIRLHGHDVPTSERAILVCGGTGCHACESEQLVANFQDLITTQRCVLCSGETGRCCRDL
jgi:NADH-quinone oxidoreductase subunit F